jgi:hypothetical protein
VLVRVDDHAVAAAEPAPERVQALAQLRVTVAPRVPREPSLPRSERRFRLPVAEGGGDDAPRAVEQRLRVARALGLRHRELHPGEEAACATLDDVPLGLGIRLGARDSDGVEPQLVGEPADVGHLHARIVPA